MSVPDRSIDPRLLSAAKEEFLQKGFKDASLAEICKAAGVTTGALYKRYEGKEALFSSLVADTVREMEEFATGFEDTDISHLTDQELYDSLCMTPESITEWMKSLYEHREAVTLLVRCAAGTRFENFHHDWAERMCLITSTTWKREGAASPRRNLLRKKCMFSPLLYGPCTMNLSIMILHGNRWFGSHSTYMPLSTGRR